MNVLLTSAGRRSYLVRYFKEALAGTGQVICANVYPDTPAMCIADHAETVPFSHSEEYIPVLIDLCRKYDIGLICSCHDLDVFILSKHVAELQSTGAAVMVPDAEWGQLCLDKYECSRRLQEVGINVPWFSVSKEETLGAIADGSLQWPVVLKARMGFGSLGLRRCENVAQFEVEYDSAVEEAGKMPTDLFLPSPPDQSILIQQAIDGAEYCIDVVNDLQGNYVDHLACQIHAMRSGESDQAVTVDPSIAGKMPRKLSELTKHPGIWGIDIMDDGRAKYVIDVNPRFTGDYPFSHIAGANVPAALLAWARRQEPDPAWLRAEIGVRGYKDLVPTRIVG